MNASPSPDDARSVTLPNGRRVTYALYGRRGGTPVLFCHGFPGSRLQAHYLEQAALDAGAEVIAPDRPGVGGSTDCGFGSIAQWAEDAEAFLTALGVRDSLGVIGVSGGGPYALAIAARLPERVRAVALVASPCELEPVALTRMRRGEALALRVARRSPALVRMAVRRGFGGSGRATRMGMLQRELHAVDQAHIATPHVSASLSANRAQALAGGTSALERESVLYLRRWGFDLADVHCPVDVYYGELDQLTPPFMGERIVEQLADARLHLVPQHGHFTLLPTITAELLARVIG